MPQTDTAQFVFELTDPCNPPTSLLPPDAPGFENQDYLLGDSIKSYTHPSFKIEPPFCPINVEYIYTKLADGRTAV